MINEVRCSKCNSIIDLSERDKKIKKQATADFIKMIEKLNLSKYNWTVDEFITELLKELK